MLEGLRASSGAGTIPVCVQNILRQVIGRMYAMRQVAAQCEQGGHSGKIVADHSSARQLGDRRMVSKNAASMEGDRCLPQEVNESWLTSHAMLLQMSGPRERAGARKCECPPTGAARRWGEADGI